MKYGTHIYFYEQMKKGMRQETQSIRLNLAARFVQCKPTIKTDRPFPADTKRWINVDLTLNQH